MGNFATWEMVAEKSKRTRTGETKVFFLANRQKKSSIGVVRNMKILNRFPFKNMPTIVDLLADGEVGIREIAATTGMCSFDSREVSDMLAYLTSFGRVTYSETGWSIQPPEEKSTYEQFRLHYINELTKILNKLSTSTKTVEHLSQETGLPKDAVNRYLSFLAEVTRLGVISRCSTTYPVTWCAVSST